MLVVLVADLIRWLLVGALVFDLNMVGAAYQVISWRFSVRVVGAIMAILGIILVAFCNHKVAANYLLPYAAIRM